jgi:dihydrodiol dehydrogenase / D-xylose 1-dehydrogenase (NADP)
VRTETVSPMAAEADATILALREGRTQAPEMPWFETLATARLLADWRAALA